jgi:hypothetical protein
MTIQDLGSLGELIAAIATIATLAYLSVQVRQNTRALRSATFESISDQMAQNVLPLLTSGDLAEIAVRGFNDPEALGPADRLRFNSLLIASIRRMESVYIQERIGALEPELARGFELSLLSLLQHPSSKAWWESARITFNDGFVEHVDAWLRDNEPSESHPSTGVRIR